MTDPEESGSERSSVDKIGDCHACLANVRKTGDWMIDESTGRVWHYECAPDPDEDSHREQGSLRTDGGEPQETGTECSVYLAGPIEADDDPRSWRDELCERFPEVGWIDPMDWQDEWAEDPAAVWEREMETVRNNAVLVCNIGDEAPRTTGTHHEIREALNHGQPVGIVPEGTVSQVYREIEDVCIYDEVKHAVADLTAAEIVDDGLRADGGTELSPHRRLATETIDKAAATHIKHLEDLIDGVDDFGLEHVEAIEEHPELDAQTAGAFWESATVSDVVAAFRDYYRVDTGGRDE